MEVDEKAVAYRALKIAERTGVALEEARARAADELQKEAALLKQARRNIFKESSKELRQFKKIKAKSKKTSYTVGGKAVRDIVSGGLPSLGKNK